MFGGLAAKVNGHIFAGLFGRSTMLLLPEPQRTEALALEGAEPFDPMGDGRRKSDKVMLPEAMMEEPDELRRWVALAFREAAKLAPKTKDAKKPAKKAALPKGETPKKAPARKTSPAKAKSPSKTRA